MKAGRALITVYLQVLDPWRDFPRNPGFLGFSTKPAVPEDALGSCQPLLPVTLFFSSPSPSWVRTV